MTVDFKDSHTPESAILHAVFFYVTRTLSYRDPVKIMAECSANVGHTTLKGWVVKYAPAIAKTVQARKQITAESWQMDEIYIKVKRRWGALYWAVDKYGKVFEFKPSNCRDKATASLFFRREFQRNSAPYKVLIDKCGANLGGLQYTNLGLKFSQTLRWIDIPRVKYLNNISEQDPSFTKKHHPPDTGAKAFHIHSLENYCDRAAIVHSTEPKPSVLYRAS